MDISLAFLQSITVIITSIYLLQKVKLVLLDRYHASWQWITPVLFGILSVLIMLNPFSYDGLRFDMRSIPIFLAAYIGGWRFGIISLVIPVTYRLSLDGPGMFSGIVNALILAALIGALLRDPKIKTPISPIRYKHLLGVFIFYQLITLLTGFFTLNMPIVTNLQFKAAMLSYSLIALIIIVLMLNDTNRQFAVQKKLQHLSNHDPMTNLPNLRYFMVEADHAVKQDPLIYVAMVDIDYFKQYNDTYGHPAGDDVIRSVGQLLKDHSRSTDIIARYGGEEFIILFRGRNDSAEVITTANVMRLAVEQFPFKGRETQPEKTVTISIGLSSPSFGKNLKNLVSEADEALYAAKHQGRNKLIVS
jgi:diguanylate cyclase